MVLSFRMRTFLLSSVVKPNALQFGRKYLAIRPGIEKTVSWTDDFSIIRPEIKYLASGTDEKDMLKEEAKGEIVRITK